MVFDVQFSPIFSSYLKIFLKKKENQIFFLNLLYFNVWFCIFVFAMHKRLEENFGGVSRDTLEQYSKREEEVGRHRRR